MQADGDYLGHISAFVTLKELAAWSAADRYLRFSSPWRRFWESLASASSLLPEELSRLAAEASHLHRWIPCVLSSIQAKTLGPLGTPGNAPRGHLFKPRHYFLCQSCKKALVCAVSLAEVPLDEDPRSGETELLMTTLFACWPCMLEHLVWTSYGLEFGAWAPPQVTATCPPPPHLFPPRAGDAPPAPGSLLQAPGVWGAWKAPTMPLGAAGGRVVWRHPREVLPDYEKLSFLTRTRPRPLCCGQPYRG